ncbi:MAG: (d)CMP kinase [Lachnospirales bacterium]
MGFQVAIDGTTSSGKSSIAKEIAKKYGFLYLDTGAMYRAVALNAINKGFSLVKDEEDELTKITENIDLKIDHSVYPQKIVLNGKDVTDVIRSIEAGENASRVSVMPKVREILVNLQRKIASDNDIVMDGRDIGSVVLPKADVKLYVDASSEVRAKRRTMELSAKGEDVNIDEARFFIEQRDERDKNREVSPLIFTDDAIFIDNGEKTFEEVTLEVFKIIEEKRKSV